jgi:hypothetical protein
LIGDEIWDFLDEPGLASLQIENVRLIAEYDTLGQRSGTAQGNSETGMAGGSSRLG